MFGINWLKPVRRALLICVTAVVLVLGGVGCGDRLQETPTNVGGAKTTLTEGAPKISEVSPPEAIQKLGQALDIYQPQVAILNPQADEVLQDTTVTVRLRVQDLPIFLNSQLGLGPHLEVILDNQPYTMVYDVNQPLVFPDLAPGTHTLRVFASRPWHESFKNEGAYAQTTFHIFAKTDDNKPNPDLPLLTYSRPTGSYGAEPIALDFYLTNVPLHLVAQEKPDDEIVDWRVRVTVNGESFVIDRWQTIYLKGFQRGQNWVQLEYLDEKGNPVKNAFNNTVRLITYEPKGKDTLSKLIRGELSVADARGIVDPTYSPPAPAPIPEPVEPAPIPEPVEPAPIPEPVEPAPIPEPVELAPILEPAEPAPILEPAEPAPIPEPAAPSPTPTAEGSPREPALPKAEPAKSIEMPVKEAKKTEKPKGGGFFNRFRLPAPNAATRSPIPSPILPEAIATPTPEPVAPGEPGYLPEIVPDLEPAVVPESAPAESAELAKERSHSRTPSNSEDVRESLPTPGES